MNRKHFLTTILPASLVTSALAQQAKPKKNISQINKSPNQKPKAIIIPPYLKPGDIIGITSPAGYTTLKEITPAIEQIKSWGFEVKIGDTIGKKDFTFGGTDDERLNDFQAMLDDVSVKAILCARGGIWWCEDN